MSRASITAVVLAGGRGSRLKGRDKGLVEVAGKALISHVIERIQPHVKEVIISANRNGDKYASKGYQVLPDEFEAGEYAGPLAGVLAGLDNCDTEFLLTVPCDTPCLPDNLVEQLSDKVNEDHEIVSVNDGEIDIQIESETISA